MSALANRLRNAIETEEIFKRDLQKMKENKKISSEQKNMRFYKIHIRILQYLLKASQDNNQDLKNEIKRLKHYDKVKLDF